MKENNLNNLISIVLPCFNHGKFIQEAIDSIVVEKINYSFEIIIVDDGSTDEFTIKKLSALKQEGYNIIHQTNGGPAKARNTGIRVAKGKYILPLDADNKINPDYINKALPLLENELCDIVYAKPTFFGETGIKKRKYKVKPFEHLAIVTGNFADACAIYRKTIWEINLGYDEAIPYFGFEDWEFWINAASKGFRFHFIKEQLFYYRINANSTVSGYNEKQRIVDNHRYIAKKHSAYFLEQLVQLAYIRERYDIDIMRFPITPFIYLLYWLKIIKRPSERAKEKLSFYSNLNK